MQNGKVVSDAVMLCDVIIICVNEIEFYSKYSC